MGAMDIGIDLGTTCFSCFDKSSLDIPASEYGKMTEWRLFLTIWEIGQLLPSLPSPKLTD